MVSATCAGVVFDSPYGGSVMIASTDSGGMAFIVSMQSPWWMVGNVPPIGHREGPQPGVTTKVPSGGLLVVGLCGGPVVWGIEKARRFNYSDGPSGGLLV